MTDSTTTNLLETRALCKYFDMGKSRRLHAVDQVSLAIAPNEILGLVGESGSGKSTFGKTLIGLHDRSHGEAHFKGELLPGHFTPEDHLRLSRQMQMIFQDPYSSLNPRMTILDVVGEGLYIQGIYKRREIRDRVAEWLEKVGLHPDHMSRYPHEFSGGQHQRIGIARAMIIEPEFVVCDEPISALDVSVQAQIINLLDALKNAMGLTMLFIAHDLSMVRYVSDRMAVMYMGSLVEVGPSNDVFFSPQHPYTRLLVESNPEPDPDIERQRSFVPIAGEVTSPINPKAGCRFANRCPQVMEVCRRETPSQVIISDRHWAACHQLSN